MARLAACAARPTCSTSLSLLYALKYKFLCQNCSMVICIHQSVFIFAMKTYNWTYWSVQVNQVVHHSH